MQIVKIPNEQKILRIKMMPVAYTKCEIGQDWYKNELEIHFWADDCYPDYMEVNEWIMKEIDGKTLNIEDVVEMVYDFLKENYSPLFLEVHDHVRGCKTHFDVEVIK